MPTTVAPESAERMRNQRVNLSSLTAWTLLAAIACFAAMATPFILGHVYLADDLGAYHLPLRAFYSQQLQQGEPFEWMPSLFGGYPIAAEGQLGGYHPLHLLLYGSLPLWAAFDLELLLSYPLLFAGMAVLLRRLLVRSDAALFGALAFTFGSFSLLHFVHPNAIAIVAHIPWLLFAIDISLTSLSRCHRALAELAVGLLTASQILLGYPQYVWFSLLAEAALVLCRWPAVRREPSRLGWLLLAKFLGLVAGAVQLLPTLELLQHSARRVADAQFANSGSLHPLNLVQLLAPYLFQTRVVGQNTHELGMYLGAAPCLLILWLIARRTNWGEYRRLICTLLVLMVFSMLLAAGEHGGLYRLQSWLPLINRFRFPCRTIVLFQLTSSALAAVALTLLLRDSNQRNASQNSPTSRVATRRALVGAVVASIVLAVAGPLCWPQYVASRWLVWCGPALIGFAALLIWQAERGRHWAVIGLVLFSAGDLAIYGLSSTGFSHTGPLAQYVQSLPVPPDGAPARIVAPAKEQGQFIGNGLLLAGLTRGDGYAGLLPAKRLNPRDPNTLRAAGVQWQLEPDSGLNGLPVWTPIASPAPRARLVSQVEVVEPLPRKRGADLQTASVELPLAVPFGPAGTARLLADRPGRLVVETRSPTRQLLVTTESLYPGWRAYVDDSAQPVVPVDGDFLGCLVEAGTHQVRFAYEPASLRLGALISACGVGLLWTVFGWGVVGPIWPGAYKVNRS